VSIVADASVVLAWLFEEDQTPKALAVLRLIEHDVLLVPPLWWSELENGVVMGERRDRKTVTESAAFLKLVRVLPIQTDDVPRHRVSDAVIDIARRHQLTAYDATYVELAVRESASLATFDAGVRRCASSLATRVLPARL